MTKSVMLLMAAALLALTACGALASGELVLPAAEDLEKAAVTAGGLDWTAADAGAIAGLVETLKQSVVWNTGRASVQDVPDKGDGLVRIEFCFKHGGSSVLFLYQEGGRLFLEQPYQGIYEMDGSLGVWLQNRLALGATGLKTTKWE